MYADSLLLISSINFHCRCRTFGEIPLDPRKRESAVQPISFEFEPSINIVSGPNGFGKSSLVNAIALCCGSSAVFLRRGKTYKDLIHRGEKIDQAEIELHLYVGACRSTILVVRFHCFERARRLGSVEICRAHVWCYSFVIHTRQPKSRPAVSRLTI